MGKLQLLEDKIDYLEIVLLHEQVAIARGEKKRETGKQQGKISHVTSVIESERSN